MEETNLQHVQVPNDMVDHNLTIYDQLIYATIKRFQTGVIKNPKVSISDIVKKSGLGRNTVFDGIQRLIDAGYIKVLNANYGRGRTNQYAFDPYKKFEVFDYKFLDKEDLTAKEKAYIIALQQKMFKDIPGKGKISMTNEEISKETNLSMYEVSKLNRSLIDKNYLTILSNQIIDKKTGLKKDLKVIDLEGLEQMIIWKLKDHEAQLELQKEINAQQREVNLQQEEVNQEIFKRLAALESTGKLNEKLLKDNQEKDREIRELKKKLNNQIKYKF